MTGLQLDDSTVPFRCQWILHLLYQRGDQPVQLASDDCDRVLRLEEMGLVDVIYQDRSGVVHARLTEEGCRYVERTRQ